MAQSKLYGKGLVFQSARAGLIVPYDDPKSRITTDRIQLVVHSKLRGTLTAPIGHNVFNYLPYTTSTVPIPVAIEFDNVPTRGIAIQFGWNSISGHGNYEWRLVDPRGFHVSLQSYALARILKNFEVVNMRVQDACTYTFGATYLDVELSK